ncbi:hypothetical protein CHS0354_006718, partial [Potamilus streckersoni]
MVQKVSRQFSGYRADAVTKRVRMRIQLEPEPFGDIGVYEKDLFHSNVLGEIKTFYAL